jgi:hypothetical protein
MTSKKNRLENNKESLRESLTLTLTRGGGATWPPERAAFRQASLSLLLEYFEIGFSFHISSIHYKFEGTLMKIINSM